MSITVTLNDAARDFIKEWYMAAAFESKGLHGLEGDDLVLAVALLQQLGIEPSPLDKEVFYSVKGPAGNVD